MYMRVDSAGNQVHAVRIDRAGSLEINGILLREYDDAAVLDADVESLRCYLVKRRFHRV